MISYSSIRAKVQHKVVNQPLGSLWQFTFGYNVKYKKSGNEILMGGGKFIHYFSPENLPSLTKHIIFAIDVSGSMHGKRLKDTQDAMLALLDNMKDDDR